MEIHKKIYSNLIRSINVSDMTEDVKFPPVEAPTWKTVKKERVLLRGNHQLGNIQILIQGIRGPTRITTTWSN